LCEPRKAGASHVTTLATPRARHSALGKKILDRPAFSSQEILIAFTDRRADLRIADLALVLLFVGGELRDDGDGTVRNLEFNPVAGLENPPCGVRSLAR